MNYSMIIMSGQHTSVVVSVCENSPNISKDDREVRRNQFPRHPFSKRSTVHQREGTDFELLNKTKRFNVFVLLESFLNLCYYLLLVPIRISKNSRGFYCVKSSAVHKALCTLIILVITLFSLVDLRHYQRQHNLRERPDQTFQYATIFIVHWIPVCWLIIFWARSDRFVNLLNTCQSRLQIVSMYRDATLSGSTSPEFRWWKLILKITIFLTATKNVLLFLNEIELNGTLEQYMDSVIDRFLYNFGLETKLKKEEWPKLMIYIGYVAMGIRFILEFVIYMFDQLCFTAAAMVFASCQDFLDKFQELIKSHESNNVRSNNRGTPGNEDESENNNGTLLRQISTAYLNLNIVLDGINKIFGPCIVMFFMYLYPLFIWSVFDSVQNNSLIENLIRVHDMFVLCLVTGTAAEASSKVELFRQWLFEAAISNLPDEDGSSSNNALLRLTTMHREVSSEAVGLKGYKFFTVTYRFVATMIGVVITYAIVMFQFVMAPGIHRDKIDNDMRATEVNSTLDVAVCTC